MSTILLRGREHETAAIGQCARDVAIGAGRILLVEGGAGTGKTALLDTAVCTARARGFVVGTATASRATQTVPMAPLIDALFGGATPVIDPDAVAMGAMTTTPQRQAHRLEPLLANVAQRAPICVAIDDLHWADDETVTGLRLLSHRLRDIPVLWAVAYRARAASASLTELVAQLRGDAGTTAITASTLDDATVARVATDILGAAPAPDALELAARANGNAALLTAVLRGAVEEGSVTVRRGQVGLRSTHVPDRVVRMVRGTIASLSPTARRAAATAAVLDRHATFDRLVEMLGVAPTTLLGPVDELFSCDLLADAGEHLRFGSELVRHAVVATLPPTAHRALSRHAVDVLVDSGVAPVGPATELADHAEPGDRGAVMTLTKAIDEVRLHDVDAAAELSRRALVLTPRHDDMRPTLAARTALLLHGAGRTSDAMEVAGDALRAGVPPAGEAVVRLAVARMYDVPAPSRLESGRLALALPDLPRAVHDRHAAQLAWNLLDDGRIEEVAEQLATVHGTDDVIATRTYEITSGRLDYARGEYRAALARGRRATAQRLQAEALLALDEFGAAEESATRALARARRTRHAHDESFWRRFLERCSVQAGRLADVQAGDTDDDAFVTHARVAVHKGDHRRSIQAMKVAEAALASPSPELRRHAASALMLCAMATDDVDAVSTRLATTFRPTERRLPVLVVDVADPPQLVRYARAAADDALAREALETADTRAEYNPGTPSIEAAALHAHGLADDDPSLLAKAADRLADSPRRLAYASALEDLGVAQGRHHDHAAGVEALSAALRIYTDAGAMWDASRTRQRLRRRGVRRRLVTTTRPTTGWDALTGAEHAVVRLVAEGLTNREVAARLFVSPHTASMHLRHVFTKLQVNSRVELTRLVMELAQSSSAMA
jgi:DNA-binding CsgD family transcriptional regulator